MPRSLQGAACELCDLALPAADLFGGREGKGEGRGGRGRTVAIAECSDQDWEPRSAPWTT